MSFPATKLVFASDADNKGVRTEGESEDIFFCDGVADDVDIQSAIDALPSGGGKVVLSEGTFTLAATIQPVDGLHLIGAGVGATTIILADGAVHTAMNTIEADAGTANAAVSSTNTTMTDTRKSWTTDEWVGYHVTSNDKRMTVTSNTATVLTGASWTGGSNPGNGKAWTLQKPSDYVTIEGIKFDGNKSGQTGGSSAARGLIDLTYWSNFRMVNCRVTNGYDNGTLGEANTHTTTNTRIEFCEIDNCGQGGFQNQCDEGLRMVGTDCHDNTADGLLISDSGASNRTRWQVIGGHFYANGGAGIDCNGSSHGNISDCTIQGNTGDGIDLTDAFDHIIANNKIADNGGWGIKESNTGGYHEICSNRFTSNTSGDVDISVGTTTNTLVGNYPAAVNQEFGRLSFSTVADGGTVAHTMLTTPEYVIVTPTVSGEIVSVTAISSTTFTVAIKKISDGSAGTTQSLYWMAGWMPA